MGAVSRLIALATYFTLWGWKGRKHFPIDFRGGSSMADIAIITDTTSNIPEDYVRQYNIEVVPQVLIWEEETLYDEVDITAEEFYTRLQSSDEIPTTSQATIAGFQEIFKPHVENGTPILAILISTELSGTVQSALQAKKDFPHATIEIIDSRSVAMALGFQVLAAARAAEQGKSFEEIVQVAKKACEDTGVIFVVDTLEYLHRGGRIGGASRLLGTALALKPLLHVEDGRVEPLERVRTKAKATSRLLDLIETRISGCESVQISAMHAASEVEAAQLLEKAKQRFQPTKTFLSVVGPVIGTHVGPGTVGLAFYKEK
jgi:DegV family protein with EDD domain